MSPNGNPKGRAGLGVLRTLRASSCPGNQRGRSLSRAAEGGTRGTKPSTFAQTVTGGTKQIGRDTIQVSAETGEALRSSKAMEPE